jgi:transcription antitermination protein NusB
MTAPSRRGGGARRGGRTGEGLGAARLAAVQALYQGEVRGADAEALIAEFRHHRLGQDIDGAKAIAPDEELFAEIVRGAMAERERLDALVADALPKDWPLARLEVILRAILRAGAWELASRLSMPARAAINEYVEIGHAFFSGSEPKMVNAVLDALARRLRPGELEARGGGR